MCNNVEHARQTHDQLSALAFDSSVQPCVQAIPSMQADTSDVRMSKTDEWVIVEYRPHNNTCKFNTVVHKNRSRETAYPRRLLARAILPRYITLLRCSGKRPSNEAIAQMLQPYVRATLLPSTSSLTLHVASMLQQMSTFGTGVHALRGSTCARSV